MSEEIWGKLDEAERADEGEQSDNHEQNLEGLAEAFEGLWWSR